jgi:folate-dependent phosphoribosylglycinamide formyltransferase PurN
MWGISCLAEKLLSAKLELCSTELVACVGFEVLVQAAIMSTVYWNVILNIHVRRT